MYVLIRMKSIYASGACCSAYKQYEKKERERERERDGEGERSNYAIRNGDAMSTIHR